MRKLLIFMILAAAIAIAILMVQLKQEPLKIVRKPSWHPGAHLHLRRWKNWLQNRPENDPVSQADGTWLADARVH